MEQTDRQTDKASNWKTAIFDVEDNWSKLETLPVFVKTVFKQQEVCPTTQRPHFQVHIVCHRQVRLTQMCSWIKHTKWIPVKGVEHIANSIKYCSKKESAVEGTYEEIKGSKYYQVHELLLEVAKRYSEADYTETNVKEYYRRKSWAYLTSKLLDEDITWATKLCNPALEKCWKNWGDVFLQKARAALIIEGSASEAPAEEE